MKKVELSPDETGYLLGLLRDHLEYYRRLAGHTQATQKRREQLALLEGLWVKLNGPVPRISADPGAL